MTKPTLHLSLILLVFALGACGSDDGDDGGGAGTGGGGSGGSGATGGSGTGGTAGAPAGAEAFCTEYETVCGLGATGRFATKEDCLDDYANKFDDAQRSCVEQHLGYAASNLDLHCPHATGTGPCA